MEYFFAFQVLSGFFAAFLASRKSRSTLGWFAIGMLVPLAGVIVAWKISPSRPLSPSKPSHRKKTLRPPKRCCGHYIPGCQGCPFFEKPLFDRTYQGERKGYCKFYNKDLLDQRDKKSASASAER
jgi:hypothetical protein